MTIFALHKALCLNHISRTPSVISEAYRHTLWISAEAEIWHLIF